MRPTILLSVSSLHLNNKIGQALTSEQLTSKAKQNAVSVSGKEEEFFEWAKESRAKSGFTFTLKLIVDIDKLSSNVRVILWKLSKL